jgi:hypothetical protein
MTTPKLPEFFIILAFSLFTLSIANAQEYTTGVGLRMGPYQGITVKHFTDPGTAIEGILATQYGGFYIAGLYEKQQNAFETPGLDWFYGAGGHIGSWGPRYSDHWVNDGTSYTAIGIDGIIGMEYTFDIPINIGLDWKPAFNLTSPAGFWGDGIALSVRYVFN